MYLGNLYISKFLKSRKGGCDTHESRDVGNGVARSGGIRRGALTYHPHSPKNKIKFIEGTIFYLTY